MSTDAMPQFAEGDAEFGYWPPRGGSSPEQTAPKMLYVVFASVLGIVFGTLLAAEFGGPSSPVLPRSASQSASAPVQPVSARAPAAVHSASTALGADAPAAAVKATAQLATPASIAPPVSNHSVPVVLTASATRSHRAATRAIAIVRLAGWHRSGKHRAHNVRKAPQAVPVLAIAVLAPAPIIVPPVRAFMIEGDVTVAGYDEAAGRIETREGMNFMIDRTLGERNASLLEDSGSFHYRCDQQGSCTLAHAGLAFSAARTMT